MKRTSVDDLHKEWMKNPKYRREYEALKEEFSLTAALIEARSRAVLTQQQAARRMKTTQAVVAAVCHPREPWKNTRRSPEAVCASASGLN